MIQYHCERVLKNNSKSYWLKSFWFPQTSKVLTLAKIILSLSISILEEKSEHIHSPLFLRIKVSPSITVNLIYLFKIIIELFISKNIIRHFCFFKNLVPWIMKLTLKIFLQVCYYFFFLF